MKPQTSILIALDSVGIDPLGHNRPESVYSESRFLFPRNPTQSSVLGPQPCLFLPDAPVPGFLIETDVTNGHQSGAIECALTYTSIFCGSSALARHGLMQGLGLREQLLVEMIAERNLFREFGRPCLANAVFPLHCDCFGGSFVEDLLPAASRQEIETAVHWRGKPVKLTGRDKHGTAELFTLAEINRNIFIHAARQAGVRLRTYEDVRSGAALTSSLTHELEAEFDFSAFDLAPLPLREVETAAGILSQLAEEHDFVFYKYQIPDLVSHTGQISAARAVFQTIEAFVAALLNRIDPAQTVVVITSDHGHLEQIAYTHGHPKTKVPTWCFGLDSERAKQVQTPEAIFHLLTAKQD
ncbi:MAG: hypothetical protein K1Y36_03250 [Blastocatellia bacterium]|nr:hypothetical protein [Blastocatellia bacterium]